MELPESFHVSVIVTVLQQIARTARDVSNCMSRLYVLDYHGLPPSEVPAASADGMLFPQPCV